MRSAADRCTGGAGSPWPLLLLPLLVALAYLPSLPYPFQFDDYNVIVDNPAVHSLDAWWRSMPGIRPLLKLSYALNWTLAPDPAAFRLANIVLHALNVLLVWRLLVEIGHHRPLPRGVALLASALFALHPVQTEAVTYVCGRSVTLMAFFYLLSLLAWLVAARTGRQRWALLSGLAFLCAFLSKETALILPLALWLLSRLTNEQNALRQTRLAASRWPLLAGAAAVLILLTLPAYRDFFLVALAQRPLADNLALQVDAVVYLSRHLLQPALMNADPALPTAVPWDAGLAIKASLLLTIVMAAALGFRRRSLAGLCALWFFLHLAPTNSLVPRIDVANDRQLYLASIGAFVSVALLAAHATERLRRASASATLQSMAVLLAALLLTVTGWQTIERNRVYRSEIAFWQDVIAKSPQNARAFNNLGYAYQLDGRLTDARAAYLRALALKPSLVQAQWNLASLPQENATAPASPDRPSSAR